MNFLKKLPIRYQFLIIAVSVILIMFSLILFTYSEISKIIMEKNDNYMRDSISQIKQTLTYNCDSLNKITTTIPTNSLVQEVLLQTDPIEKWNLDKKVHNFFDNMRSIRNEIVDIVIIGDNGNFSTLQGGVSYIKKFKETVPRDSNIHFSGINTLNVYNRESNKYFIVGTNIYAFDSINKISGFLAIIVDAQAISPELVKITKSTSTKFYLLDKDNNIYASNDNSDSYGGYLASEDIKMLKAGPNVRYVNGVKQMVYVEDIPFINGKIIGIVPQKELFYEVSNVIKRVLLIFTLVTILFSVPFLLSINNILQPLKKLMAFMNGVKSGDLKNLKKRISLEGYAEVSVMAGEFNGMLDEIDALTHRLVETSTKLYQAELATKQSELAFLQSQINPHFLYNTLAAIKGIAIVKGVTEIKDMTMALGNIFRYSIKGTDEVLFQDEIDIVKYYIQIQQIRFPERLFVKYDIEEEALICRTPKMILQPIVENAIFHGLEPKEGTGNLFISALINANDELIISIMDDGVGISEETLDRINNQLHSDDKLEGLLHSGLNNTSIGVVNVHNRIWLTYGEKYGISLTSSYGKGTVVLLKIPARRDKNV